MAPVATAPAVTGFTTILGVTVNPMVTILAIGIVAVLVIFYRVQQNRSSPFDFFDLVMEDGKASITRIAFLAAFLMTTWVIVDQEIKHTLTDAGFGAYLLAWVAPLTARYIFNKGEPPIDPKSG